MKNALLICLLTTASLLACATSGSAAELASDLRAATPTEQALMEAESRKDQPAVAYTYSNARVIPSLGIGAIDTASANSSFVELFTVYPDSVVLYASIKAPVTCLSSHEADAWDVDIEALGIVPPDQCSDGLGPFLKKIRIKTFNRRVKAYNRAVDITNRRTRRVCQKKRSTKAILRCARSTYNKYAHAAGDELTTVAEDFAATVSWANCKKALLGLYTNQEAAMDARLAIFNLQLKGDWIEAEIAKDDESRASRKAKRNVESIRANCPAP